MLLLLLLRLFPDDTVAILKLHAVWRDVVDFSCAVWWLPHDGFWGFGAVGAPLILEFLGSLVAVAEDAYSSKGACRHVCVVLLIRVGTKTSGKG
jgi:hypothetical protein